jgi:hypothetical protein
MQRNNGKASHQCVATFMCPALLPAIQDGDIDALLDTLLSVAERSGRVVDQRSCAP